MNTDRTDQPLLATLRRRRKRPAVWFVLFAYLVAGAIVPPGYMATALASGSAFHLCPGDLRSAQLLLAFAAHAGHADNKEGAYHAGPHGAEDPLDEPARDAPGHEVVLPDRHHVGEPPSHAPGDGENPHHGSAFAEALEGGTADAGCTLASSATAALDARAYTPDLAPQGPVEPESPVSRSPAAPRWLRPPVRSPPR